MNTRHLVDPQLLPLIDAMPALDLTAATLAALREHRAADIRAAAEAASSSTEIRFKTLTLPGLPGEPDVKAVFHEPQHGQKSRGAILHFHGGGYVLGEPYGIALAHSEMAQELGCVILSVDYRLAPETRYPGALRDGYAALGWLHTNAERLKLDRSRIGVMGESAGGGLAAALALFARDQLEYPLAFQHLTYPMIDDRTGTTGPANPNSGEFIWTRACNRFGWEALLGYPPGGRDVPIYAAPARAEDLSQLPSTYISAASLDLFIDENIEFARRLIHAGVHTELRVYAGAYHGFHLLPTAEVTQLANRETMDALRRLLARRS